MKDCKENGAGVCLNADLIEELRNEVNYQRYRADALNILDARLAELERTTALHNQRLAAATQRLVTLETVVKGASDLSLYAAR